MASQNRRKKFRRYIQLSKLSTQFLVPILQSHVWLRKAFKPEGQTVDCGTTGWTPYIMKHRRLQWFIQSVGNSRLWCMVAGAPKGPSTLYLDHIHDIDKFTVYELRSHYFGIKYLKQSNYQCRGCDRGWVWNDPKIINDFTLILK